MIEDLDFLRLQAEARYARERYQLYKARTLGPKPSDPARLAELERVCDHAEGRLRRHATRKPGTE
jgi:hypothetical protein